MIPLCVYDIIDAIAFCPYKHGIDVCVILCSYKHVVDDPFLFIFYFAQHIRAHGSKRSQVYIYRDGQCYHNACVLTFLYCMQQFSKKKKKTVRFFIKTPVGRVSDNGDGWLSIQYYWPTSTSRPPLFYALPSLLPRCPSTADIICTCCVLYIIIFLYRYIDFHLVVFIIPGV